MFIWLVLLVQTEKLTHAFFQKQSELIKHHKKTQNRGKNKKLKFIENVESEDAYTAKVSTDLFVLTVHRGFPSIWRVAVYYNRLIIEIWTWAAKL